MVKAGDLLFTIDRRPFQIALAQAQASLAQAKATLAFAESDLARAQGLAIGRVITQQTFDQRTQARATAEASVAVQQAAERQAALDLEFSELRAPVSGRIGDRRVSVGNLVTGGTSGNTSLLATIESIDPVRLEFTLDEASFLRYGHFIDDDGGANRGLILPVKLKLLDESAFSHEGKIDFVDNAIDRSSSTIRARAVFANPDGRFTPGMFARVRMAAAPPKNELLVPEAAVGVEQASKFVLVVDAENIVRPKYVKLGPVVDGLRVITQGLSPDDNVVINGLMRARPGTKVTPQQSNTAPASTARAQIDAN
jgi:RND family efflux transporter MFP subunit